MDAHKRLALLVSLLAAVMMIGCPGDDDDDTTGIPPDDDTTAGDDDTTPDDDDTGDDDTTPDDDDSGDDDTVADPCSFLEPPAASIEVVEEVTYGTPYSRVYAWVGDTRFPAYHEVTLAEGACRYLSLAYGNCDPPCDPVTEVCAATDVCEAYPLGLSAGVLDIAGLAVTVSIETSEWSPGYYWGPWDLPTDIYDAGDAIAATFEGDVFPATSLAAVGVETLDSALEGDHLEMHDGQDAEVTWTPGPDPEVCVRVEINGVNASHGLPLMDIIECVGTDTGSLVIPAALVEEFPTGQTQEICVGHDCPPSELTRYTRDATQTSYGVAELQVRNSVYFFYDHTE